MGLILNIFLWFLCIALATCIIISAFTTTKDYQDYWKKKELNRLLRGFDEDEIKFYTQIFDKIQQSSNYIKFTSFEIIINEINISYSNEREHNCLSLQITKDSYDKSIFIFPDDHNEEVLNFLTEYAFAKAYKLHQIEVDKQQKDLIEQNKQKIKKLIK